MRNNSIDVLKLFLAFLVVIIHVWFAHRDYTLPISRCAVPCFFLISGYLTYDKDLRKRLRKSFSRTLWLCIWSTVLYSPLIILYLYDEGFLEISKRLSYWLILNEVPNVSHLWYLYAYLYSLAVVWLFDRCGKTKFLIWSSPILILISVALGKYSFLFGFDIPFQVLRNFVFTGIPFFCIGMLIKQYLPRINYKLLLLAILVLCITSIYESVLTRIDITGDMYLSSPFLAISLLLFVINKATFNNNTITQWGGYSLYVYIFHPYILMLYQKIVAIIPHCELLTTINNHAMPMVVFILTLLLVILLDRLRIIKVLK